MHFAQHIMISVQVLKKLNVITKNYNRKSSLQALVSHKLPFVNRNFKIVKSEL